MCIIVYKSKGRPLPDADVLRTCWDNDPDGAGLMWADGNQVNILKGFMTWPEFLEALYEMASATDVDVIPMALHFRIATHGAVSPGCCHPFAVKASFDKMRQSSMTAEVGFMHNGTLSGLHTDEATSDSMAFAKTVLVPLKSLSGDLLGDERALKIVENSTQGSRFLLMGKDGRVRLFGNWVEDGGIYYSNRNFIPHYPSESLFSNSAFDAWDAFGGLEDDLARYRMFDACRDCPMLLECAEYLPICTDEEQASEMVAGYA